MIKEYLDKENLHHAYLIEGAKENILPELLSFIREMGVLTAGNPDFIQMDFDTIKIEDARNLKSYGNQKGFSESKRIFLITTNSFLLEAQNTLLKLFEEPIENTHFFLIMPDTNVLLPTIVSRFYLIKSNEEHQGGEYKLAEKFLSMPVNSRMDFMKELLVESENEEESEDRTVADSSRSRALRFINALELRLHENFNATNPHSFVFEHIMNVRKFLRMPGSSAKSLMESLVLILPMYPQLSK